MRGWLVANRGRLVVLALVALGCIGGLLWAQGVGDVQPGPNQVIFYEHANWGGNSMSFDVDQKVADLRSWKFYNSSTNWNDKISSIKVGSQVKVALYKDINYKGDTITLSGTGSGGAGSFPNLTTIGWNDKVSSFKVQPGDLR